MPPLGRTEHWVRSLVRSFWIDHLSLSFSLSLSLSGFTSGRAAQTVSNKWLLKVALCRRLSLPASVPPSLRPPRRELHIDDGGSKNPPRLIQFPPPPSYLLLFHSQLPPPRRRSGGSEPARVANLLWETDRKLKFTVSIGGGAAAALQQRRRWRP